MQMGGSTTQFCQNRTRKFKPYPLKNSGRTRKFVPYPRKFQAVPGCNSCRTLYFFAVPNGGYRPTPAQDVLPTCNKQPIRDNDVHCHFLTPISLKATHQGKFGKWITLRTDPLDQAAEYQNRLLASPPSYNPLNPSPDPGRSQPYMPASSECVCSASQGAVDVPIICFISEGHRL
ncbi:hypothetical protein Bbelb_112410 [Branchiostoma belcheri]|nr:hypothetical protein Bbelb_112410 [Branchiostoma belcheri]